MQVNLRDIAAGAVFVAIGLFFALNAWLNLRIGHAFSMGPGYFPVLLGTILIGLGLAIAVMAIGRPAEAFGAIPWRGVGLILLGIVFFAVTVRGLGLAISLGGATIMAGLSSGRMSILSAILVSAVLTAFCILVFVTALGLPYPVIGPWLHH